MTTLHLHISKGQEIDQQARIAGEVTVPIELTVLLVVIVITYAVSFFSNLKFFFVSIYFLFLFLILSYFSFMFSLNYFFTQPTEYMKKVYVFKFIPSF